MRIIVITLLFLCSCSPGIVSTRTDYEVSDLSANSPSLENKYLKVHLKNGKLAVFHSWQINSEEEVIRGSGEIYNVHRVKIHTVENTKFNFDECVLLETNDYHGFNVISPLLMTLTIFTSAFTIPCLGDPKTCFGSCPTYYIHQDDSLIIQAEGFSSSITRSMEEIDIDYISAYKPSSENELRLELKNEALETHYIRRSEILAIPRLRNSEIYHDDDKFYSTTQLSSPIKANYGDEELLNLLKFRDRKAYLSKSDSSDLTAKESIILEFDQVNALSTGIVITQKQSLMTTFLFYQSLAYMGSRVGELMAAYERASPLVRNAQKSMYDILGSVEVGVLINGKWKNVGRVDEQGPITTDTHIIPVGMQGDFSKVKLTMTKGLWRIDQVALCTILDEVEPILIQPSSLLNNGVEESELLNSLNDPEIMLVNNPGTSYTLVYELPKDKNLSLFLKTQGYYTEWMRSQWLEEEDHEMVRLIIRRPNKWLRIMSPKFKVIEAEMDSLFWSSKFGSFEY